ncbi:MAG: phosphoketolase family protein, partial [Patescibacteria group bacterium]
VLAVRICNEMIPELKVRYVNVSEISGICMGDFCNIYSPRMLTEEGFNKYFTKDKPVVINYHGYINDVEQILWNYAHPKRFSIHGYSEEGSTTTPFDMAIRNKVSRYHIAMDLIEQASKNNKTVAKQKSKLLKALQAKVDAHHDYIVKYGDDPVDIKNVAWPRKKI